jgi:hypothetical protein
MNPLFLGIIIVAGAIATILMVIGFVRTISHKSEEAPGELGFYIAFIVVVLFIVVWFATRLESCGKGTAHSESGRHKQSQTDGHQASSRLNIEYSTTRPVGNEERLGYCIDVTARVEGLDLSDGREPWIYIYDTGSPDRDHLKTWGQAVYENSPQPLNHCSLRIGPGSPVYVELRLCRDSDDPGVILEGKQGIIPTGL